MGVDGVGMGCSVVWVWVGVDLSSWVWFIEV